jgi:uncharacterized protein (TIGR01319 family)
VRPIVCVDTGSTFTKAAAVDLDTGALIATASHPTTAATDVLDGLDAAVAALGVPPGEVLACSSAGGGLRLAVCGYERAITAEAGRRAGLSAGARIVHVSAGELDPVALAASAPDLVLLTGGTDGGNAEVLLHNAAALARARLGVPVVAAGNAAAADRVHALLAAAGQPVIAAPNVLPRIGILAPGPARAAIREAFLRHVIGGKNLSAGDRFARLVRGPTPDLVLTAVELLADGHGEIPGLGDVVVVDVGGATTDVYSVLRPDPEEAGLRRSAAGTMWRARTVEGDLGVRWSAPGIVEAARAEKLLDPAEEAALTDAAAERAADPGFVPATAPGLATDQRLAELAATIALRRHARDGGSRDLRPVRLVVASGGAVRHAADPAGVLRPALADHAGGWLLPENATAVADRRYVLAAAGLLATDHPAAAARLLSTSLVPGATR